jgi:hypothetical protein
MRRRDAQGRLPSIGTPSQAFNASAASKPLLMRNIGKTGRDPLPPGAKCQPRRRS